MKKFLIFCVFFLILQNGMSMNLPNLPLNTIFNFNDLNGFAKINILSGQYIGETLNNKRHGKGLSLLPDGSFKHGTWQNNKLSDYGIITIPVNSIELGIQPCTSYKGEFVDDLPKSGSEMVIAFANGDVYAGEVTTNLMPAGKGTMLFADKNEIFIGERETLTQGNEKKIILKGTYLHKNGTIYIGSWEDNKKHGIGIEITNGNEYFEVEYDQNKLIKRTSPKDKSPEAIMSEIKNQEHNLGLIMQHMMEQKQLMVNEIKNLQDFIAALDLIKETHAIKNYHTEIQQREQREQREKQAKKERLLKEAQEKKETALKRQLQAQKNQEIEDGRKKQREAIEASKKKLEQDENEKLRLEREKNEKQKEFKKCRIIIEKKKLQLDIKTLNKTEFTQKLSQIKIKQEQLQEEKLSQIKIKQEQLQETVQKLVRSYKENQKQFEENIAAKIYLDKKLPRSSSCMTTPMLINQKNDEKKINKYMPCENTRIQQKNRPILVEYFAKEAKKLDVYNTRRALKEQENTRIDAILEGEKMAIPRSFSFSSFDSIF